MSLRATSTYLFTWLGCLSVYASVDLAPVLAKESLQHSLNSNHPIHQPLVASQTNSTATNSKVETATQSAPTEETYPDRAIVIAYSLLTASLLLLVFVWVYQSKRVSTVHRQLQEAQQQKQLDLESRNALQDRINRLQRMESLGMLATGVAHDFNNLLIGVMCNAELLELEKLQPFAKERVAQILISSEKAAELSRKMLAYTGKHQADYQRQDVNHIVTKMSRLLSAIAGDHRSLTITTAPESLVADVDKTQIEQILLNLVTNARNAGNSDMEISINTGQEQISEISREQPLFGNREDGGEFVYLEVLDTGSGFDPSTIEQIFEPYFSDSDIGHGLGLSVVYGIVNSHNGLIRASSVPGQGSQFRILIPKSTSNITHETTKT